MTTQNSDDAIEKLLKQHFQQENHYIDDDGFSASVMSSLPQKAKINPWLKYSILWSPICLVALLVFSDWPWLQLIHETAAYFIAADFQQLLIAGVLTFLLLVIMPIYFLLSESES